MLHIVVMPDAQCAIVIKHHIPVVGYMDELFAVLSIPVFVFELKKNQFKLKIQKCTWGGMLGSF